MMFSVLLYACLQLFHLFKIKSNFIYFVFGCAGSSLLCSLFSSYSEQGLFVVVRGLLVAVAALVSKYGP